MAKPWAQLVSTADLESDPVMITESSITIGRAPGRLYGALVYYSVLLADWPSCLCKIEIALTSLMHIVSPVKFDIILL